jgi:hypothetical protein
MSALEQGSLATRERRVSQRFHVAGTIPVVMGRGEGVLIDLSEHGARIRHFTAARRGSSTRVSFEWNGARFSATAEVLAARVVSLGNGPSYESRVRFKDLNPDSQTVLLAAIDGIVGRDVRKWVANLRGWTDDAQTTTAPLPAGTFIRCRLHGTWWERKVTSNPAQPPEGFLLPAETSEAEIETLCTTYVRGTEEERNMIKLMSAAAVEHVMTVRAR